MVANSKSQRLKLAIIGCGLHARRIYVQYCVDRKIVPALIVDTVSNQELINNIIKKNGWDETKTFFVNVQDPYKAFENSEQLTILNLLRTTPIDNAIISTPPEIHTPYSKLCLDAGVRILVDKPLSAPRNISNGNSEELVEDYKELLNYEDGNNISVQCQRRRHDGYRYIHSLIDSLYNEYGVQPHFIDIYHSDGRWDFPDEIPGLKNHPYSAGYGKLLHSGYHFIDLLAFLTYSFDYDSFDVFAYKNTINDFKAQVNDEFYKNTFNIKNTHLYKDDSYGEIDSYSLVQLKRGDSTLTTASINLLHSGFSRRAWGVPKKDSYKGNGRIRHERVNIQIGPLMNIQLHSYQSSEIHDKTNELQGGPGSLEHFGIHIYRNTGLIGGAPYEMIPLDAISEGIDGIGQNENARYLLIDDFLSGVPTDSELRSHLRTNLLLAGIAKSMHENTHISRTFQI